MKSRLVVSLFTVSSLAFAAGAFAQSSEGSGSANGAAKAGAMNDEANASAHAAAETSARSAARLEKIKEKGAKVSAEAREKAESKLDAAAQKVNETASKDGDASMAKRLGADLRLKSETLIEEKSQLDASWGDLTIAHTLAANSKAGVNATQLLELNHQGTGWGQIAAGLGLGLNSAVTAVNAQSRVAQGLAKADGKVAVIHGEGARAGMGSGLAAGVKTDRVNAGATLGAGVKVGN